MVYTGNWRFPPETTHTENTTTAHGAVSAATASKLVVRDGEGQAKFAAPAEAGDALIKGTRHLIAEMPTLTTGKVWKGVGGVPAEVDVGATLTVAETEVFDGNSPDAWTDLDLSAVVGANPALVLLKIYADNRTFAVRKNGDTDEFYVAAPDGASAGVQGGTIHMALLVATDAAGIIEWICSGAVATTVDIIAYIK